MNLLWNQRNFTALIAKPMAKFVVERYSHNAIGGPKMAVVKAIGRDDALWELMGRLRSPVEIYTDFGELVWWGLLWDVRANIGGADVGVSLDNMFNQIYVAYVNVDLTTGVQTRGTTAAATDAESQNEYGIKELIFSAGAATSTHAEAARDMLLSQKRYPQPIIKPNFSGARKKNEATLVFRGIWNTFSWRYYANTGTSSVDTATQVAAIITAKGQFILGTDVINTSGISIRETRDGDNTALYTIEELLGMGTTNFRRLLAKIDSNRRVYLYEEPATSNVPYQVDIAGKVFDAYGAPIRRGICPVAAWCRLKDIVPASVDSHLLADPSHFFIEESEYVVAEDRLILTPRDDLAPWDFPKTKEG